jgi:hypothetical protein
MAYQRHYDDYFLDGIHNYLPDVLYGRPEQFGASAPLVSYIQSQVRRRFDLFSAGQRTFVPTFIPQVPIQTPPRVIRQRAAPAPVHFTLDELNRIASMTTDILGGNQTTMFGPTVLQGLLGLNPPANFMEPVVVRPTAAQIEAGTSMEIVDAQEEMCAICQDTMPAGSQARCLNVCDHRFHPGCIDTWFQRDVRCPTCRHDVRDPAAE